ncbi:P27 family phage terminase small subunit [Qipengyuania sp.]|uniref:P27 family phage terminase small subunit n=1 Tax=Qipengyuania sp. TaxID=2004515 RepID=UPI0035C8279C
MPRGGSRPGSGRKRKEPELKALAGNLRHDRTQAATTTSPGSMICPVHLGDLEQLMFGSIAKLLEEQGRASPHWVEHVALTAMRLAQIQLYKATLEVEGHTYETESLKKVGEREIVTRMVRARPEVSMLNEAMRHAQSLLGELMLNPTAAMRLVDGHKREPGAFDDF